MTLATLHNTQDGLTILAWLFIAGCLVAAAIAAWRGVWVACGLLLVVAIIAGAILL